MVPDPELSRDEATGFTIEHCHSASPLVGDWWMAYPDERVIYHLHRGNNAIGDTREQAIARLSARHTWGVAA